MPVVIDTLQCLESKPHQSAQLVFMRDELEFGVCFCEEGKSENQEKNPQSKVRTNNKPKPHVMLGWNGCWATLVGGREVSAPATTPSMLP